MAEKKSYETAAHANDGYVTKDDALIVFRGALDHAQAEIIVAQAVLDQEVLFARSIDPVRETNLKRLQSELQELVDVLRDVMTAEYTGEPLPGIEPDGSGGTFRLFGLTLDELQEHSHHAQEHYGIPTMTRPDHRYGEVYARLNLIRTELRQVEVAGVRLFRERAAIAAAEQAAIAAAEQAGIAAAEEADNAEQTQNAQPGSQVEPARPDLLYVLNRLSSAAHVLMCRHLSEVQPKAETTDYIL